MRCEVSAVRPTLEKLVTSQRLLVEKLGRPSARKGTAYNPRPPECHRYVSGCPFLFPELDDLVAAHDEWSDNPCKWAALTQKNGAVDSGFAVGA
jgi:hypothetical protein